MNNVVLIGRLCDNPTIRYISESQMAVATFIVAIDRPVKQGAEKKTDFPRVTVFGRQAENCERFISKGSKVGIQGRIQTGSYKNKDGLTIYTTDVIAERVEFLDSKGEKSKSNQDYQNDTNASENERQDIPEGFQSLDDDIPF